MPPKKDASQSKVTDNNKKEGNKDGKKKKKILAKGTGMGGTIGLTEKPVKNCKFPCVKSFSQPPACCPQQMTCPPLSCCPPAPSSCPQTIFISSPPACCRDPCYM